MLHSNPTINWKMDGILFWWFCWDVRFCMVCLKRLLISNRQMQQPTECGRRLVVEGWSIVVRDGCNNQLKCRSRLVSIDLMFWSYQLTHQRCEGVAWNSCRESEGLTRQQCEDAAWNFRWWSNGLTERILFLRILIVEKNIVGRSKVIRIGSDKRKQNNASILVLLHPWFGPTRFPGHLSRYDQRPRQRVQLGYRMHFEVCHWVKASYQDW